MHDVFSVVAYVNENVLIDRVMKALETGGYSILYPEETTCDHNLIGLIHNGLTNARCGIIFIGRSYLKNPENVNDLLVLNKKYLNKVVFIWADNTLEDIVEATPLLVDIGGIGIETDIKHTLICIKKFIDKHLGFNKIKSLWLPSTWKELDEYSLLYLSKEILLHIGLILTYNDPLAPIYAEYSPWGEYKLIVKKQLLDDSMTAYLRIQSEALKHKIMVIAEFEKSIAEGALGRFGPEMKVAMNKQINEKQEMLERLTKNLTIVCPEIFLKV